MTTIGILDWGIGGIGFYRAIRARRTGAQFLYWSDTGSTPYGKLSARALARRVTEVAGALKRRGADHLVIACNAASTALPSLGVGGVCGLLETDAGPIETTGVIAHAIGMVQRSRVRRLGIVGGARTIRSGAYRRALATRVRTVEQRIAQPLSALIERGARHDAREVDAAVRHIVAPLAHVDALLLACTHYPAIAPAFLSALPGVRLLDPVDDLADWVSTHWIPRSRRQTPKDVFLTTGQPQAMRLAASRAFGVDLPHILTQSLHSR